MSKTVTAIYENGVFRPLKKVRFHEREKVELNIFKENESDDITKTALSIIGVGKSSVKDSAAKHDEYLYGKKRGDLQRAR
ncbi:MAG: DUF104 domain-containing protein [Nitrospirae bacterium]|nr:MAG: DUF104 domain-containing protein [Nitrospirota bacterium]